MYSLSRGRLVSGKVLFELTSALDVVASEMLLISAVDSESAEHVKSETTAEVDSHGVLSAIVEKTLEARHFSILLLFVIKLLIIIYH